MHEARPTPDAALALHAHQHVPLGEDADVARLGPFVGMVERGARRAIAFLDFLAQVIERKHRHVLDARLDVIDRRRRPGAHALLEQRLHEDFGGPREHAREPLVLGVGRQQAGRGNVHGDDQLRTERARGIEGHVGDDRAVNIEAAADLMRREVARQRAGGEDRVGDADIVESGQSPEHFHPGVQVYGVHDDGGIELLEGEVADGARDEVLERLPPEQRGGAHALERHVGMRDREDVLALEAERDLPELGDAHPAGPRGAHERAHARPDDAGRPVAALEQRLQHAYMGEPLHPAAAQNEGERCVAFHSPIRLPGGLSPE